MNQADVACFEIGYYGGAYGFQVDRSFPQDFPDFSYDFVSCTGTENRLMDCSHSENTTCSPYEGIRVNCDPTTQIGSVLIMIVGQLQVGIRNSPKNKPV